MSIRFRRGTNSQWEANKSNIIAGEPAITTDTGRFFVGVANGSSVEFLSFRRTATISANSSATISVPNSFKGVLYVFRPSSAMGMYMISCSSGGTVSIANVLEATDVTITASSNAINVANNSSSSIEQFYIGNNILTA